MIIKVILSLLLTTPCFAQVIGHGSPEQRKSGIYETVWIITEPGRPPVVKVEKPTENGGVKVTTCVETENGCEPSRYFITTITDSEG
jgi:hypothetical protein